MSCSKSESAEKFSEPLFLCLLTHYYLPANKDGALGEAVLFKVPGKGGVCGEVVKARLEMQCL